MGRLIIDENSVYELDEACVKQKERKEREHRQRNQSGEEAGLHEREEIRYRKNMR